MATLCLKTEKKEPRWSCNALLHNYINSKSSFLVLLAELRVIGKCIFNFLETN